MIEDAIPPKFGIPSRSAFSVHLENVELQGLWKQPRCVDRQAIEGQGIADPLWARNLWIHLISVYSNPAN